jgi:hypothetical protein
VYLSGGLVPDETHYHDFCGTELVDWQLGAPEVADLWLRQPADVRSAMLRRSGQAVELLRATEVVAPTTGQVWSPPPLDEVGAAWAAALPAIPAVGSFCVQQVLVDSPFGAVPTYLRIDGGRVVEADLGVSPEADLRIVRRYALAVRERAGAVDLMDSLEGGRIEGDFRVLTALLGLYESDEWVAARRALDHQWCEPLARLGEALSAPSWQGRAARLEALSGQGVDAGVVPL